MINKAKRDLIYKKINHSFELLSKKIKKVFPDLEIDTFENINEMAFSISFLSPVNDDVFSIEIEIIESENIIKAKFGIYDEHSNITALMKKIIDINIFDLNSNFENELLYFIISKSNYIINEINYLIKLSKIEIPKKLIDTIIFSIKKLEKRITKKDKNTNTNFEEFNGVRFVYFRFYIQNSTFGEITLHFQIVKKIKNFEIEVLLDFLYSSLVIKSEISNKKNKNISSKKIDRIFNRLYKAIFFMY